MAEIRGRTPVGIFTDDKSMVVMCDDGTFWELKQKDTASKVRKASPTKNDLEWVEALPPIPGSPAGLAREPVDTSKGGYLADSRWLPLLVVVGLVVFALLMALGSS